MPASPTLPAAPDFARRLGVILAGLAALVARRFLRDPFRAALVVPLWTHLTHAARRLNRAFARLAAARAPRPRRPRASGPRRAPTFPTRRGWLVAALGSEAASYATQIESLLAEPTAAAALARSLAARRTLAPIRRMLGLTPPRPRQRRVRARARPQPPPPPHSSPRPLREGLGEGFAPPQAARPWWLPPRCLRSG